MTKKHNILAVLLGIVLGVLITLIVVRLYSGNRKFDGDYNRWRKLNLILQEVQNNYVDTINMSAMTDAAVVAALAKLDPHSVYLPPVELTESETELAGNFEGIGITFNVPNDTAIVLNTIPGGPSEKVGLAPGDRIIKVGDRVIAGNKTPQDTMIRMMKGPSGSKVEIHIRRDGQMIPFEITRGKIPIHSVDAAFMVADSVGYIKLSKFSRSTYKEFSDAVSNLLENEMTGLVFDLRDNTGGYFDQALLISNEFLQKGESIVYMQGMRRARSEYKADGRGVLKNIRLSVLIDEGSASSSEIFAGAIQDNDRGLIVGRRSYGKGLVQEPINFTDGSGIRLTVARFYTPSGRCIQKPYHKNYQYDIYERYAHGEMTSADSIRIDSTSLYFTKAGRRVFGGGGIIPDVFVPIDTTRATDFYLKCNKKSVMLRFSTAMFDRYKSQLQDIDDFSSLELWMGYINIEKQFLDYAYRVEGLKPTAQEWAISREYMMPQIMGLTGRFSKIGEEAFHRFFLPVDRELQAAISSLSDKIE